MKRPGKVLGLGYSLFFSLVHELLYFLEKGLAMKRKGLRHLSLVLQLEEVAIEDGKLTNELKGFMTFLGMMWLRQRSRKNNEFFNDFGQLVR